MLSVVTLGACSDLPTNVNAPEVAIQANRTPAKGTESIGQIAIAAANAPSPEFTQLVAALQFVDRAEGNEQNGLVALFVAGRDQYTVFAPTDAAFRSLYALAGSLLGTEVTSIEQLPVGLVKDVLLYHVTGGRRAANSVLPRNGVRTIETLQGETFAVTPGGSIRDGLTPAAARADAVIRSANLSASNGIIHVIDQVILPPGVVATLLELSAAR